MMGSANIKTGVVFVDLSGACVEGRTYVEVYEVRLLCKNFESAQQYAVKPVSMEIVK
jgi:hypothetical protein